MSARGRPSKAKVEQALREKEKAEKVEKKTEKAAKTVKTVKEKPEKAAKPATRTRKTKTKEAEVKPEPEPAIPEVKPKPEIKPVIPQARPESKPLPPRANPLLTQVSHGHGTRRPLHGLSPRILTFMGVGLLSISTYCGYLYTSYRREVARAADLNVPADADVSDRYNTTASTFDADVATSETVMRLGRKRSDLVQLARGNVLEVSCGTGRNLGYYNWASNGCRSMALVDLSPQMVEVTRQKAREIWDSKVLQRVAFRACDAGSVSTSVMPAAGGAAGGWIKPRYFDTVVQTMGLCSMPDPVRTLRHLGSITEPQQGRILLLEHGRSYYEWLNRVLDNLAPAHATRHGCWWNRDIGQIVQESGLEVVEVQRWHLGTTWRVILKPGT